MRLRDISERLGSYGDVLVPLGWVPLVGPWLSRVGAVAKVASGKRKAKAPQSVLAQRSGVREALAALDRRVVVFLDDLDRVESEQTRDVLRLVKLVADFPNVTYLLAYDARRVARAISADEQEGRDYLEKIAQVTHDLPEISAEPLIRLLTTELDAVIERVDHGPFSNDDWVNVFYFGIRPFFENLRDVRRYLNSVPVTLRVLGREVALVDALALETLRIFAPGAYARLPSLIGPLTGEATDWDDRSTRDRADAEAISALVEAASPHQEAMRHMLRWLFPQAGRHLGGTAVIHGGQEYRRSRRVAHPEVLRVYLRRTLAEGATPTELVQEAYENMGHRNRFTELLDSLDGGQLEDLLGRLEDYEREYDPAAAEVASEVLLNQLPRLREGRRGMLDFGAKFAVTRVVLRVLSAVQDEGERTEIIKRVLPRVRQLSGREELLDLVGQRKDPTDLLIPQDVSDQLYREQNDQVLAAEPDTLAEERQLVSLLYRARKDGDASAAARITEVLGNDLVFLQLLRSALSERQSQSSGALAVHSTPDLPWDGIAELVGGADELVSRVNHVATHITREQLDERTELALETAEKYVSGELPLRDRFGGAV